MKQKIIVSALGIAVVGSSALIPYQNVRAVMFEPPLDSDTPSKATGGASRGGLLIPKAGESIPNRFRRGGASGGSIFIRKSDESASSQIKLKSGGSRGDLFVPKSSQPIPLSSGSGASREGEHHLNFYETSIEQPAAILAVLPQTYFGTTVSLRPEILVYLPQSEAKEAVFSLKDAKGNTINEMNVPVSGKAGIISIKIPTDLKLEKNYQWFLALKFDGQLSPRTPYVNGWIKRILPNRKLAISMQKKDLLDVATALGKQGIWYDCVATLAKLRATQPNNTNLNKHWSQLLESVGLKQIDKAPVVAVNTISN